jgi:hypothetical protein
MVEEYENRKMYHDKEFVGDSNQHVEWARPLDTCMKSIMGALPLHIQSSNRWFSSTCLPDLFLSSGVSRQMTVVTCKRHRDPESRWSCQWVIGVLMNDRRATGKTASSRLTLEQRR